jgi:myo-inositol catabolism protein IolS
MEKRLLGKSGIAITPIVMGTWQAGKRNWVGIEDAESIQALQAAVAAGITTIDTAEIYGDGHSERIIGEALAGQRDQLVYASKVFPSHLRQDQVIAACERSLQNLQTDYLDLYQIHWPSGAFNSEIVPLEETMTALNLLQSQGKIRSIGVSNFSLSQLQEAGQYGRIDSIQPPYSLFWRWAETELQPYCLAENISILAYSPLAQGFLTGKFGADHEFAEGDIRAKHRLREPANYQRVQEAIAALRPIAAAYECTLGQLALAWLITRPQTCAIVGARSPQQAQENALAGELTISPEDLARIEAIGSTVTEHLDQNPIQWFF